MIRAMPKLEDYLEYIILEIEKAEAEHKSGLDEGKRLRIKFEFDLRNTEHLGLSNLTTLLSSNYNLNIFHEELNRAYGSLDIIVEIDKKKLER